MIVLEKIIYHHDKNCKSDKVKHLGDLCYHVEDVYIAFENIEQMEIYRKGYIMKKGYKIVDFYHTEREGDGRTI